MMKKVISILLTLVLAFCFSSNLYNLTTNGIVDSAYNSQSSAACSFEVTHSAHKFKAGESEQDFEIKYAVNIFKTLVAVSLIALTVFLPPYRRILLERKLEKLYYR